jgi:hypothetical protein
VEPSGYIPGYHIPGTLVPIGAVMEDQRRQAEQVIGTQGAAETEAQRQRRNLLLLLR